MKKFLANLGVISLMATVSSQAIACGPATFAKLMNRKVDPTIYRGTFAAPMSSWSVATTQTANDSWILINANDMLLSPDQYNNFEGDLADNWAHTPYQGQDESGKGQDFRAWSFHVRTGEIAPVWTSLNRENIQKKERAIVPRDFFNTFRFIFNPNNIAQTVGVWQQIIDYGDDLYSFLSYLRNDPKVQDNPYPELYDSLFSRTSDPGTNNGVVQSSFYLDRAILAFNLNPVKADDLTGMKAVRARALEIEKPHNDNLNYLAQQNEMLLTESFTNGKIINGALGDDQKNFNLTYNLLKPAEYFESMASFSSFSPLPDESVDYLNIAKKNMAGTNYGAATVLGEYGYQRIFYSGAYVVEDYNPSLKLVMTRNKYYFNYDNVPIEKLSYSYTGGVDISRHRFYFETGDLSEFMVSSNDLSGWKKYVGEDFNNPRFPGTNIVSRPQAGTQALFFNYNSTFDNSEATNQANQTIAQRSTRAFIRYILNRSEAAKFYSKARDGNDSTSHNLRNTWTAPNVGNWKKDSQPIDYVQFLYQDYMKLPDNGEVTPPSSGNQTIVEWLKQRLSLSESSFDQWNKRFGSAESENAKGEIIEASSWIDGADPYLRNDLIGAYTFLTDDRGLPVPPAQANDERLAKYVSLIGDYSPSAESEKLSLIKEQVREDLSVRNIATSPVTLIFLADGSTSTGLNNYIKQAVQSFNFNVGSDSPIKLQVVESKDRADYSTKLDNGEFSIIIFGWISDYSDPYGFLHAMVYQGDLGEYAGFSRLFDNVSANFATSGVSLKIKPGIKNPSAYEDLRQRLETFTNKSSAIDLNVPESPNRYTQLAEVENYSILESMISMPILTQYLDDVPYVSYVNPFTRTTFASGSPVYRFVGVSMVDRLWDHATFNLEKQKYEAERNRYKSKFPGTNGRLITVIDSDWRKSNQ